MIENAEKSKSDGTATANRNVAAATPKTNDTAGVYQTVGYDPNAPASTTKPAKKDTEGENTFEVYGFAMLDTGYQFGQNHPDWFDVLRPTKLPSFHDEFAPSGKVFYGVRQSRLGFKSSTPTKWGELKTIFEFELFGTGGQAGQTIFRLRHAYGELGHFGAGQYWTTFGDTDAYPNTIEYWGPNGLVWFRNVQVRWMPIKGRNSVTIALERPGASGDQGNYADRIELSGIKPRLAWPDLAGNVRFDRDWGHIQISGLLRSIRWTDTNNSDNVDLSGSAVGGGVSFSSHFNFSKDNIGRFQFTYGTGIENYMNDAAGRYRDQEPACSYSKYREWSIADQRRSIARIWHVDVPRSHLEQKVQQFVRIFDDRYRKLRRSGTRTRITEACTHWGTFSGIRSIT